MRLIARSRVSSITLSCMSWQSMRYLSPAKRSRQIIIWSFRGTSSLNSIIWRTHSNTMSVKRSFKSLARVFSSSMVQNMLAQTSCGEMHCSILHFYCSLVAFRKSSNRYFQKLLRIVTFSENSSFRIHLSTIIFEFLRRIKNRKRSLSCLRYLKIVSRSSTHFLMVRLGCTSHRSRNWHSYTFSSVEQRNGIGVATVCEVFLLVSNINDMRSYLRWATNRLSYTQKLTWLSLGSLMLRLTLTICYSSRVYILRRPSMMLQKSRVVLSQSCTSWMQYCSVLVLLNRGRFLLVLSTLNFCWVLETLFFFIRKSIGPSCLVSLVGFSSKSSTKDTPRQLLLLLLSLKWKICMAPLSAVLQQASTSALVQNQQLVTFMDTCFMSFSCRFSSSYRKKRTHVASTTKKSRVPFIEQSQSKQSTGEFFPEGLMTWLIPLRIQCTTTFPSMIIQHIALSYSLQLSCSIELRRLRSSLRLSLSRMQMCSWLLMMNRLCFSLQNSWEAGRAYRQMDCLTVDSSTSRILNRLRSCYSSILVYMFVGRVFRRGLATNINPSQRLKLLTKEYQETLKRPLEEQGTADRLVQLLEQIERAASEKQAAAKLKIKQRETDTVKEYVMSVVNKQQPEPTPSERQRKIPNNLTLHKLKSQGNELLLVGVEQHNLEHALFVRDLMDRMKLQECATQLPPDSPFLIKTEKASFRDAWRDFIGGRQYSFFLNNRPNYLHEAMLENSKIGAVRANIFNSKEYVATMAYGMSYNEMAANFEPSPFLQPFFNYDLKRLVFCDYPILKEREFQASSMKLPQLRKLFVQYVDRLHADQLGRFDPRLLYYGQLLRPKIEYMTGVLKLTSRLNKRTIGICDSQYTEFIAESWRKSKTTKDTFQYFEYENNGPFIEFIEKLVILDLVLEPLLSKYFICYRSFPYNITKCVGGTQLINSLFVIWEYYYQKYRQAKFPNETQQAADKPLSETDDMGDKYSPFPKQ